MISEKLSTDSRRMLQNGVPQFVGFCRCTRAGSAEAKRHVHVAVGQPPGCTRAGSAEAKCAAVTAPEIRAPDAPVHAAPRQSNASSNALPNAHDAPVQAAPRQRREAGRQQVDEIAMHPVQAAPRQSQKEINQLLAVVDEMHPVQAAPRQRSLL